MIIKSYILKLLTWERQGDFSFEVWKMFSYLSYACLSHIKNNYLTTNKIIKITSKSTVKYNKLLLIVINLLLGVWWYQIAIKFRAEFWSALNYKVHAFYRKCSPLIFVHAPFYMSSFAKQAYHFKINCDKRTIVCSFQICSGQF